MDAVAERTAASATSPPPYIRSAVRDVLERAPGYQNLSTEDRQSLAKAMVKVSTLAADLIEEEGNAHEEVQRAKPVIARAQEQPGFGESANRVAGTTQAVLNAVSFPRFVTDLINGVFKAMLDSSSQQMQQYVQLLNAVGASAEGFEKTQFGLPQVRAWVADHFPEAIEYDMPEVEPGETPDPEEVANIKLRLKGGASMPGAEEIRATLGMEPTESVDASSPEQLVPLARRYLARQRQQMLATMVMLGMQRIVVDSGRINASMRFHIDTRSVASEDRGSQFSMQNRVKASGSFGMGPWGASAEIENNIGYVSTQRSQSTEEMNTDLELSSAVEINFRSDYLPLNQMAAQAAADRIRNASINPAAEVDPTAARTARLQAQVGAERERRTGINEGITAASRPPAPATPAPTTPTVPPVARPPTTPTTGGTTPPTTGGTTPPTTGGTTPPRTGGTTPPTTGGTTPPTTGGTTPPTTGGGTTPPARA